jgi:hypothetical protein
MSRYTNVKININENQKDRIARALQSKTGVSIKLTYSDLTSGEHTVALTRAQIEKIRKAYNKGKGVIIKMSETQLKKNASVQGGFIGALLPLLATAAKFILPSLATGALSRIGSKVVDKISGSGVMYLKKGGLTCKVMPAGQGLFLTPWAKGGSLTASGLYLKSGSGYVDGKGLLLGPNSPFANIPILGMLL